MALTQEQKDKMAEGRRRAAAQKKATLEATPPQPLPEGIEATKTVSSAPTPVAAAVTTSAPAQAQPLTLTVDAVTAALHQAGSRIPTLEDVAFDSLDQVRKDIPPRLAKIFKDKGLRAFRLGYDGLQFHELISSGLGAPVTRINVPEAAEFCGPDGLIRIGDLCVCVAEEKVLEKHYREPQRKRNERYLKQIEYDKKEIGDRNNGMLVAGSVISKRDPQTLNSMLNGF